MNISEQVTIDRAETDNSKNRARIPALDGVRGLAVLAVMLYHFSIIGRGSTSTTWLDNVVNGLLDSGWAGVDLFFVLSGFLITGILLDAKSHIGYFKHFYARRALRIWPAYFILVFLLITVLAFLESSLAEPARVLGERIGWYLTFTNNILVTIVDPGLTRDQDAAGHLWSIAIEEQFYLIWPVLVLLLRQRALMVMCGAAILGAFAVRVALEMSDVAIGASVLLMPARMDGFAIGAIVALAVRNPTGLAVLRRGVPWIAATSLAMLVALFATLGTLTADDVLTRTFGFSALALLFGSLLVYVVGAREGDPGYGPLVSAPLRALGKYSYALYLFHVPINVILEPKLADMIVDTSVYGSLLFGQLLFIAIAGITSFVVAWLSWQLVEAPFLRLKALFPYGDNTSALTLRPTSWIVAAVTLAAVGLTVFVVMRGGWIRDPVPNDAALTIGSSVFREADGEITSVMLVGDSVTRSLSAGLYSQQDDKQFVLRDITVDSCGVMPGAPSRSDVSLGDKCDAFRARWHLYVEQLDPDVVLLQVSLWDSVDRLIAGSDVQAGSPDWEMRYRAALQDSVAVFSSRGASVVLLTSPYTVPATVEPAIVDQLNDGARFVAAANAGVSLVDLDQLLDQRGAFRSDLKGVTVRSNDDVHFTVQGSELVGDWLAPQLIDVAPDHSRNDDEDPTDADVLSRLVNTDTSEHGAWRGWQSSLLPADGGILVSSSDVAYSAYVFTDDSDLPLVPGDTYEALVWVRSATEIADGEIEIVLREEASRDRLSQQFYRMTNYWQPIVVEHTIEGIGLESLELLILRLGTEEKPDAFVFRDAELRLASGPAPDSTRTRLQQENGIGYRR